MKCHWCSSPGPVQRVALVTVHGPPDEPVFVIAEGTLPVDLCEACVIGAATEALPEWCTRAEGGG